MPGLVMMDSTQPAIKDENAEDDDFFRTEPEGNEDDDGTYKPRPQLPDVYPCMRDLDWLFKCLESGAIDVEPEYQRDVVWTADRMTGLVDSLMENYYIPPIILNKKIHRAVDGSVSSIYVCVDGKQRLTSIKAFIKGMIPCHDYRGNKWWFEEGIRKKGLPEDVRKEFLAKEFVAFEYSDLTRAQEEELFARVQMGMSLTLAEKMHAQTGPWQELARMYVQDFPTIFSLLKDQARAKPFQLCLSCFSQILEVQHPSNANGIPILKTNFAALPKLLANKDAVDDETKSHLASVFRTFHDLIEEDQTVFTEVDQGVQTFSPLELVAVAVLISMYSETRNNELLLGDIRLLRTELRDNYRDIRLNTTLWSFTWKFLENLEGYRGAADGSTIDRQANSKAPPPKSSRESTTASSQSGNSSPSTSIAKRGRPTMRTQPTKLSTSSTNAVDPSPGPRQRKRPRLDDSPQDVIRTPTISPVVPSAPSPQVLSFTGPVLNSSASLLGHTKAQRLTDTVPATRSTSVSGPRSNSLPNRNGDYTISSNDSMLESSGPTFGANSPPPRQHSGHGFAGPAVPRVHPVPPPVPQWSSVNGPNTFRAPVAPMMGSTTSPTHTLPVHHARNDIQSRAHLQLYNQWHPNALPSNAEWTNPTMLRDQLYDTVGAALAAHTSRTQSVPSVQTHSHAAPPPAKKTPVPPPNAGRKPPTPSSAVQQPHPATTRPGPLATTKSSSIASRPAPSASPFSPTAPTNTSLPATSAPPFSIFARMQTTTPVTTPPAPYFSLYAPPPTPPAQQEQQPVLPPRRTSSTTTFRTKPIPSPKTSKNNALGTASSPFAIDGAADRDHDVVDLTSDTEQERQDLLSTFRMQSENLKGSMRPLALEKEKKMAARWESVTRKLTPEKRAVDGNRRLEVEVEGGRESQASAYSTDSEMPLLPIRPREEYVRKKK
ncbi:hypothetical protein BDV96DRAFT_572295 [Lophiotrema nucula]|uniref:GmrSD restriction endonucleases N-terminal domain-containing protein n=1 Tax=Lophiotrema nucula TaxID=690887 RepID=A0A6A5ZAG8_9PLEO|nr:hypothetical protein BDV96DRAFT_572295 [Lophiotrema nucula]